MNKKAKVIELLKSEGFEAKIQTHSYNENKWETIDWDGVDGERHTIYENDIEIFEEKIAWFQSGNHDNYLLRVFEEENNFSWEPKLQNPFLGGGICLLLEWFREHLIFIYQDGRGQQIYICAIKDKAVKYFNFHGEEIERNGELISYDTYGLPHHEVRLIKIPELIAVEPISIEEAVKIGIIPRGVNREDGFLRAK